LIPQKKDERPRNAVFQTKIPGPRYQREKGKVQYRLQLMVSSPAFSFAMKKWLGRYILFREIKPDPNATPKCSLMSTEKIKKKEK
jgi:hypothetical protein